MSNSYVTYSDDWSYDPYKTVYVTQNPPPPPPPAAKKTAASKRWFIDFQYYQFDGDQIYPKEFSLLSEDGLNSLTFVTKSPPDVMPPAGSKTVERQFSLHKTPWNHGDVVIWQSRLMDLVDITNDILMAKGAAKTDFLRKHNFNVYNMDTFGCGALKHLFAAFPFAVNAKCTFHACNAALCAKANVSAMQRWWRGYDGDAY